jgi:mono/diheme cytochrome c family protein
MMGRPAHENATLDPGPAGLGRAQPITWARTGSLLALALTLGVLLFGSPGPAISEEPEAEQPDADVLLARAGEEYYYQYCASCHGPRGEGDGPASQALKSPPADLTRIAKRRNGKFPEYEISQFIDGRTNVQAHGSREMPVWGVRFGENIPDSVARDEIVRGRLVIMVEFLKSIQRTD